MGDLGRSMNAAVSPTSTIDFHMLTEKFFNCSFNFGLNCPPKWLLLPANIAANPVLRASFAGACAVLLVWTAVLALWTGAAATTCCPG